MARCPSALYQSRVRNSLLLSSTRIRLAHASRYVRSSGIEAPGQRLAPSPKTGACRGSHPAPAAFHKPTGMHSAAAPDPSCSACRPAPPTHPPARGKTDRSSCTTPAKPMVVTGRDARDGVRIRAIEQIQERLAPDALLHQIHGALVGIVVREERVRAACTSTASRAGTAVPCPGVESRLPLTASSASRISSASSLRGLNLHRIFVGRVFGVVPRIVAAGQLISPRQHASACAAS